MPARLKQARAARGLSQNAVAQAAGVRHPTIIRLEAGASSPSLDTLERVAAALCVSPAWLAYGIGPEQLDEP